MFPSPIILPLLLYPKVTYPPSFDTMSVSLDLSPVMCIVQPLSKYHSESLAFWNYLVSSMVEESSIESTIKHIFAISFSLEELEDVDALSSQAMEAFFFCFLSFFPFFLASCYLR